MHPVRLDRTCFRQLKLKPMQHITSARLQLVQAKLMNNARLNPDHGTHQALSPEVARGVWTGFEASFAGR